MNLEKIAEYYTSVALRQNAKSDKSDGCDGCDTDKIVSALNLLNGKFSESCSIILNGYDEIPF
jgi:hypothetical protein